jgi:hypothetical protein
MTQGLTRRSFVTVALCTAAQTACAAPARTIELEDFGGGVGVPDNSDALRRAAAAAANGGTVQLRAGTYRFASASLGWTGVALPDGVTIRGQGKAATRLVVTGNHECWFLLNETCASDQLIADLSVTGNGTANQSGPGGFYACTVRAGRAERDVRNCVLRNVALENFRGDAWILFLATAPGRMILDSGVDTGCEARSRPGNTRDPHSIAVTSFVVEFRADGGEIRAPFVNGLSADLDHVKGGIAAFGNIHGLRIRSPWLRNAFRAHAVPDVGAYAITLYDSSAIFTDAVIEKPRIEKPFSCGIYTAGGRGLRIVSPRIDGQADEADATLIKGAIALNGSTEVHVTDPDLRGNWVDIAICGVSTAAYAPDMHILVERGAGIDARDAGVKVRPSPFAPSGGGIRFVDYRSVTSQPRASALAWHIDVSRTDRGIAHGISGFEWQGGECSGGPGGFDVNLNRNSKQRQQSGRIRFSGVRMAGQRTAASFSAYGIRGGTLALDAIDFTGDATYHVDIEDGADVALDRIEFAGRAGSGTHGDFTGSRVRMNGARSRLGQALRRN